MPDQILPEKPIPNTRFQESRKPASSVTQDSMQKSQKAELKDPHLNIIKGPVPGQKGVVILASAYKSVVLYASRYANPTIPSSDWKEIYGLMIGYIDKTREKVVVTRCEPLTFGEATDVQLRSEHYAQIDDIQMKLDQEGKNEWIVGWWHSHPGLSLFFSDIDLLNHIYFQSVNPDACGLVFDHTLIGDNHIQDRPLGFEIFRITDVSMEVNVGNPAFLSNYNQVPWEIEGMNEYFFANVLHELSAKYSAGKPLEMSYGEKVEEKKKPPPKPIPIKIPPAVPIINSERDLMPLAEMIPSSLPNQAQDPILRIIKDGRHAFEQGDSFTGVEKYKQAIELLQKEKRTEELVTTLADAALFCLQSIHFPLVKEFGRRLLKYGEQAGSLVHMAQAHYFIGLAMLKEKDNAEKGLEHLQQAEISFEKSGELALAGFCNQLIGEYYINEQNFFSGNLFYIEGLKLYKKGRPNSPLLEKLTKLNQTLIDKRIITLIGDVKNSLDKLSNPQERSKIEQELTKWK